MTANREVLMTQANEMRNEGLYLAEIGRRLGVTETTVSLWTSEYAQRKLRVKRLGRVPVDRPCGFIMCRNVILASEYAGKKYCSGSCRDRQKRVVA